MGASGSRAKGLEGVKKRSESRIGKLSVSGRYHRAPKKLSDDYDLATKVLGKGYNGDVHLATSRSGAKAMYAVKDFKLHGVGRDKKEELETEAEIFLSMDHPHVCRLVDVYESEDKLSLVMECMTGGELFKRVSERKRFTEKDAADVAWQMLLALNYIHSHQIVHRDIKLENFLYDRPDSDHLKLIDFGFSKIWQPNTKMALSCGTLSYVAPEVLDKNYTSQCDLWSLGVTIFIVLFGYMPFSGSEDKQVRTIREGRYTYKKDLWEKVSPQAQSFVKKLLVVDPAERLTAEKALDDPWIHQRDQLASIENIDGGIVSAFQNFSHASTFRKKCMGMMAWSLSNEEREKVRNAFIEMDTERTGAITLHEFKKVMEDHFHVEDAEVVQIFKALDQNHQEEIHYSEFLAAMVSTRIAIHDDMLAATFKRFDVDNSGYITADNLREVLGDDVEGEQVESMIQEADSSGDGKISYQEWIEYLKGTGEHNEHKEVAVKLIDNEIKKKPDGREKTCRSRTVGQMISDAVMVTSPKGQKDGAKGPSCCCVS